MELDIQRKELLGLLERCPVPEGNSLDCPLNCVREKSYSDQIEWAVELSFKEFTEAVDQHNTCYCKRMADTRPPQPSSHKPK